MPYKPIPSPQIVPLSPRATPQPIAPVPGIQTPADIRQLRIKEFLSARSLAKNSCKAYQQDLKRFTSWTDTRWEGVTRRQVALFKKHLIEDEQLSPSTVNRVLTTLKNFYTWMVESQYVSVNPTTGVDLLEEEEREPEDLSAGEVARINQACTWSKLPERNTALVSVLLHGLRAGEVSQLNLEDYDGIRLHIRQAKSDSKGYVPLTEFARRDLDNYLDWRKQNGEILQPTSPLFLSHSNKSKGKRLTYWGIRDIIDYLGEVTEIDLHAHRFRHTYATELVLKGMDTYHIMTLTRHKSMQSFKRYTKRADQVAAERAFFQAIGEVEGSSYH